MRFLIFIVLSFALLAAWHPNFVKAKGCNCAYKFIPGEYKNPPGYWTHDMLVCLCGSAGIYCTAGEYMCGIQAGAERCCKIGGGGATFCYAKACNRRGKCVDEPVNCGIIVRDECRADADCGGGGAPTPTPAPSCTVTLSPDPASISDGATQDYTASVVPANGTVSQVNFTSSNTSIATVSPASDATSTYNTTATGESAGTTTIRAGVIMAGSETCFDTATVTVTKPDPWWQVQDADVLTNGNLISGVPGSLGESFILDGPGGFPGVAVYGGTTADFSAGGGSGTVSSTGWLANASTVSQRTFNYDYFASLIPADVIIHEITTTSITAADLTSGTLSRGYYWNRFDGSNLNLDLTINGSVNLGTNRVILLVKGANLNVSGNISVTNGRGFFLTIVGKNEAGGKGKIIVDPVVTSLEGVYFADSNFQTGTLGKDADSQLTIRGAVAAYDGMVLERDLLNDNTTPAELFEYGLDQILLYPPSLSVRKIRWKEVAP